MMRVIRLVFLLLIFLVTIQVAGQSPVFRHYRVDDGLPSSEVYHVFQDSKGYIWLATNMGVSRFDGREFRNYDVQDGLPENTVFEIYEDEAGRVWFVGFPFQLAYYENDTIYRYKYNDVIRQNISRYAIPVKNSFHIDSEFNLKVGLMYSGLITIDKDGIFKNLHLTFGNSKSAHLYVFDDRVLVSQGDTMTLYNITIHEHNCASSYFFENKYKQFFHRQLMAIVDKKSRIFFTQNNFLASFSKDCTPVYHFMSSRVFGLNTDHENNLWVSMDKNGALCYHDGDFKSGPVYHFLEGISVSSVLQDTEGGFWFSTLDDGLFYMASNDFISYTSSDGLSNDVINKIACSMDRVYIGTNDQYVNILVNGEVQPVKISETINDRIRALYPDKDGNLWIGTNEFLYSMSNRLDVERYVNNKGIDLHLSGSKSSGSIFSIKTITGSSDGGLWIGESVGLTKFKVGKILYSSFHTDSIGIRPEAILEIEGARILIGTIQGLWIKDHEGIREYNPDNALFRNRITDIVQCAGDKRTIIGTKGSGVIVLNGDSIFHLTKNHGLSSNSVTSLLITGNLLWVATNNGLNLLDLEKIGTEEMRIKIFTKQYGLISNEINQIAGNQNFIYIATNEGLTVFNRKNYKPVTVPPPIYINTFSVMKRDTALKPGYFLRHSQNFISIKFTGISFRDAGNMIYKYRLIGLGENWISTSNSQVEYAFLPPGKYQFEVIAVNSDGLQSSRPATINFVILPPFWKTWWFITLIVLAASVLAFLFYSYRVNQIRRETILRNDISWYRQQSLARQMDPHFVFNTLNSIQSYIIKNDRLSSSQYLSKFSRLMRLMLNNSQKHAVPLNDEVSALSIYLELESIRFQEKFDFHLNIDPVIEPEVCYIPAFLIQPFIENSIWHGIIGIDRPGYIHVDLKLNETGNQIICTVEDNGKGRVQSMAEKTLNDKNRKSLGISIVESRLSLLNSLYGIEMNIIYTDLYDKEGKPAGTRVRINLPIIL
jgi:ligand-binding sensor domain-containing protein/two-component sensor histidine kinase/uncharacterized protein with PQ loop repeat